MKKQTSKLRWMAAALAVAGMMTSASAADRRPNMVLFLVDVMGWMDSGVYGSEYYKTPNIDRLILGGRHELFNLKDDLGETTNLAAKHPEKVAQLNALIDRFIRDTGCLYPAPNPAYKPRAATPAKRKSP